MAKSMLASVAAVIAEADRLTGKAAVTTAVKSVTAPISVPIVSPRPLATYRLPTLAPVHRPVAAAQPVPKELSLAQDIAATWESDDAIRGEFGGSLASYSAWRMRDHSRKTGRTVAAIRAEKADVEGFLKGMPKPHGVVTTRERGEIESWATEWEASEDIRREFGSFKVFCCYMKAKAAGRIRVVGERRKS